MANPGINGDGQSLSTSSVIVDEIVEEFDENKITTYANKNISFVDEKKFETTPSNIYAEDDDTSKDDSESVIKSEIQERFDVVSSPDQTETINLPKETKMGASIEHGEQFNLYTWPYHVTHTSSGGGFNDFINDPQRFLKKLGADHEFLRELQVQESFESVYDNSKYQQPKPDPYKKAIGYLQKHNIINLFQNLSSTVIYNMPDNPLQVMLEELQFYKENRRFRDNIVQSTK